jgi:hypothetical protein
MQILDARMTKQVRSQYMRVIIPLPGGKNLWDNGAFLSAYF